ncbi:hypothetical protein FOA52_001061 [Chlamydomonas sp. UWO 241]|nr:hypothetical protein FOA52_001061 [Chlamydomonas sp. UWO 241]
MIRRAGSSTLRSRRAFGLSRDDGKDTIPGARLRLRLYQVLAPSLVGRGRHFGSATSLKSEWVCVDQPYFSAPGVELFPLSPRDLVPTAVLAREQQPVAVAFICVEGGKVWAATHREDARVVQRGLLLLTRHLLREVPGGYLVKEQSGELKIMLAFRSGRVAHLFLAAMQEATMALDWPAAALQQWPRVDGPDGLPLFNGPRLKMGVCAGHPRSIMPDYLGRADYLGDAVNQPGTQGIEGDGPWPANALVDGGFDELLITDIGSFRFKGSLQVLPMVNVCLASLAKRKLPQEPPKGKGGRVRDGTDAPLARVRVPLLTALHKYRQRSLALPSAAATAAAAPAESPHRSAKSFARAATLVKPKAVDNRVLVAKYCNSAQLLLANAASNRTHCSDEQLYVALLRFACLVLETIPAHKHFSLADPQYRKLTNDTQCSLHVSAACRSLSSARLRHRAILPGHRDRPTSSSSAAPTIFWGAFWGAWRARSCLNLAAVPHRNP